MGAGKSKSVSVEILKSSIGRRANDEQVYAVLTPEQESSLQRNLLSAFRGQIFDTENEYYTSFTGVKKFDFDNSYANKLFSEYGVAVLFNNPSKAKVVPKDSSMLDSLIERNSLKISSSDVIKLYNKIVKADPSTVSYTNLGLYSMWNHMDELRSFRPTKSEQAILIALAPLGSKSGPALCKAVGLSMGSSKRLTIDAYRANDNEVTTGSEPGYAGVNVAMRTVGSLLRVAREHGAKGTIMGALDFTDPSNLYKTDPSVGGYFSTGSLHLSLNPSMAKQSVWRVSVHEGSNNYGALFTVSGVAAHEFGHAIDDWDKYNRFGPCLSDLVREKFMSSNPGRGKKKSVSIYGDTNWQEAFAESFTLYAHGIIPTKRGVEYHSAFREVMKERGLDYFEGCLFRGISSSKSTNGKSVSGRKVENGKASGPFQRPMAGRPRGPVVTVAPRRPAAPRRPSIPKPAPSPEPPKKRENTPPPPSSGKPKTSTEKPTPKKPSTNGKPSVPSTPKKPTTKEKPSTNGKSVVEKPKPKTKAKPSTNGTSTPKPPTEKPKIKKPVVKKPTVKKPSTASPKVTGFKLKKGASQAEVDKARSNIEKLITKYGLGFTLSDYASFRKKYGSPVTTIGFNWNNKKFSAKDKLITDAWDKISAKELAQSFNIFDTLTDV